MEDFNKDGGSRREKVYSSEGRVLRPRKKVTSSENVNYGERRSFGDRPRRSFGDRPQRSGYGRDSESRSFGDRPRRSFGDRPQRSFNRDSDNHNDRPQRSFGDRTRTGYSSRSDRPQRSFGDRPQRPAGNNYGDRPQRSFGDRPQRAGFASRSDRPQRSFGDRPQRASYGNSRGGYRPGGRRPYSREDQFADNVDTGINKMLDRKPQVSDERFSDNDYVRTPIKEDIRLNKFIANSGVCSRREADTFIQAGVVTVNGEVVTELGVKVNVNDDIRFNGERLRGEEKVYVVMNKPKGYVTTTSDPHAERTVMQLLKGCSARVFPVGRLDKATTGVLMFTNDGEIAERLTHPSYDKKKIYQVLLDKNLSQEDYDKVLAGVKLNDCDIAADELEYIDENDHRKLGIEIHSGKNRVVRRIFESLGYEVRALDRVYFAGLTKKGLKKGEWRYLTEGEVNILRMGAYV